MTKEDKQKEVRRILEQSDIVWGRYGSDTIEELANRIIEKLDVQSDGCLW